MIKNLKDGGTFLLNTDMSDEQLEKSLPNRMKHQLAEKHAKFYVIDANKIASDIKVLNQPCYLRERWLMDIL